MSVISGYSLVRLFGKIFVSVIIPVKSDLAPGSFNSQEGDACCLPGRTLRKMIRKILKRHLRFSIVWLKVPFVGVYGVRTGSPIEPKGICSIGV
jgi:hypothetical protein